MVDGSVISLSGHSERRSDMEREMRRKDRKIGEAEALEILKNGEYGILSTVGEDGIPYGVPMSYAWVDGRICFHCAKGKGHKFENLMYCPQVCFTVVGATEVLPAEFGTNYESVIVFGTAQRLEGEEKQKGLEGLIEKYSSQYREAGMEYIAKSGIATDVFAIRPERISGKARRK